MQKLGLAIALVPLTCSMALAADPAGEWVVRDGNAHISIEQCANGFWGFISWTRQPGTDSKNPDPAKRSRSIVGVPILRNMMPARPNRWQGQVYNAENGKMYSASITLVSDNILKIEGCVLGGIFCGGENWTRAPQSATSGARSREGGGDTTPKTCYDR